MLVLPACFDPPSIEADETSSTGSDDAPPVTTTVSSSGSTSEPGSTTEPGSTSGTSGLDTSGTSVGVGSSGSSDGAPCPDADMDQVCDGEDVCDGGDDMLDADMDGAPDACDPCPQDFGAADGDGDGVCDGQDICPGGDDALDANMDGIPDVCPLDVLIVQGYGTAELDAFLTGWGFSTTIVPGAMLGPAFDYGPYDVVAVMYDSTIAAPAHLDGEIVAGTVGLVLHRSDALVDDFGMGGSGYWQSDAFALLDNGHFISEPFPVGPLPLDYTYKSHLMGPSMEVTVLGTAGGPSLVVHDTHRKVVTPYYGHTAGMPWNDAGAMITWRSYMWAAGVGD